jgi:radical SAM-linked protein
MIRVRFTFQKTDLIRYIGHLDLHHIWIRCFRRAHLQVAHSLGFHPQPRIQMASAISLGYTGSREMLECWLDEELTLQEIQNRLQLVLHPGIKLVKVEEVDLREKPIQVRICGAWYSINVQSMLPVSLSQKIEVLLAQPEIWTERKGKQINIRPFIHSIDFNSEREELIMHLSAGENTTGRVDEILKLLEINPLECLVDRAAIELDNAE